MKIELDLKTAFDDPEFGRSMLVALMSVLPQDEVELAIDEWEAVCKVRDYDAAGQAIPREAVQRETRTEAEQVAAMDADVEERIAKHHALAVDIAAAQRRRAEPEVAVIEVPLASLEVAPDGRLAEAEAAEPTKPVKPGAEAGGTDRGT